MQYENQLIDYVQITIIQDSSDSGVDANSLKGKIKSQEGELFSQTTFDNDLKTLAEEYDQIEPTIEIVNQNVHIKIQVWPKPLIRTLTWEGNERVKTSRLQSELGIKSGTTFSRQEFNEAFNKLKAYYVKKGFFEAQLEYQVTKDPHTNQVDVAICIEEGRAGMIKGIVFHNFDKCEEDEIVDMIYTKKYNFFTSWMTGQGSFNEEAVQQDEFMILNYLQNRGYADAKVDIEVSEAKQNNRIILHITADKGDNYYFGNLTYEGNVVFTDEEIEEFLCIDPCEPYSTEKIQNMMRAVMDLYGRQGYIDTIVNYEPVLVDGENRYDVHVSIDEGEQYRVGLIKVFGNHLTHANVILHETLLCPGEVYNMDRLKITERRLCNIGYFDTVNVYSVRSDGMCGLAGNYRDVHIEVVEGNTGHFGAFAGFSTNESVFGGFNLTEKNFNIMGLGCVMSDGLRSLRGGGEYAHFTTTIGKKSLSYLFSWTKPYFMDTPWSIGFDIESSRNRYITEDNEIHAFGVTTHATYIINQFCKTSVHYRIRDTKNDLKNIDDETKISDKQRADANNSGIVSAAGVSWIYDSTNHPFQPTCGWKSRFDVELAGIGGDYQFLAAGYLNKYYFDLWGCATLKLRGDLRFIQPLKNTGKDDLPLDERFYLGGDTTVRGYRPYKLGPRYFPSDDPKGGISLGFGSVEIGKCLFGGMAEGFIFFDAGSLEDDVWKIGNVQSSVGFGTRLQVMGPGSPPLTIGWGVPLNSDSNAEVKKFFLNAGGYF